MFFSNNFEIRTCVATSFQQYTKKKVENTNFTLDLFGKKYPFKGFYIFVWFIYYRFCMLSKEYPYHGTTTNKVFYIQENMVRMVFMGFRDLFHVKVMQKSCQIRQKVTLGNTMQMCFHDILMTHCISIMRFFSI